MQTDSNSGYQFTVKATDTAGQVAYKSFFINLAGSLQCSGSTCITVLGVGQAISYSVPPLARGLAPQTFTITGSLPPGISVSSTGTIEGTPTQTGHYPFGLIVRDAAGRSSTLKFDVEVTAATQVSSATITATPSSVTQGQQITLAWSSFLTTGCIASGGGASGTMWSGNLPVFGTITQTASVVGSSFQYTVTCPWGGSSTPAVPRASVTVNGQPPSSGGNGGSGGSGSSGGGGGLSILELGMLVVLAAGSARRRVRPRILATARAAWANRPSA